MKSIIYFAGLAGFGLFAASYIAKRRRDSGADLLDINSASHRRLGRLPGLAPEMVERILENRPYATKIDLIGRRVLPDDAYELIKHSITCVRAA